MAAVAIEPDLRVSGSDSHLGRSGTTRPRGMTEPSGRRSTPVGGPSSVRRSTGGTPTSRTPTRPSAPRAATEPRTSHVAGGGLGGAIDIDPELAKYSDRFLANYERRALLGRGGCAVVWLAYSHELKCQVAVKQVLKGSNVKNRTDLEAARRELAVADLFFQNGESRVNANQYPGIDYIAKTLAQYETKTDVFIVMEFGGKSLSKALFDVKGEFHKGARIYRVHPQPFFTSLKRDPTALKDFLRQVLLGLDVLTCYGVVHSDLKPDNILIREDGTNFTARLIDFGSAFSFDYPETLGMATPEYMAPEALEIVGARFRSKDREEEFWASMQPWSLDMWSLGCIFLEIVSGIPLWLSYTAAITVGTKSIMANGLFAVNGRDPEKIRQKQYDVLNKLTRVVASAPGIPMDEPHAVDLLKRMLAWNPADRISPEQAMEHPFLTNDYSYERQ